MAAKIMVFKLSNHFSSNHRLAELELLNEVLSNPGGKISVGFFGLTGGFLFEKGIK